MKKALLLCLLLLLLTAVALPALADAPEGNISLEDAQAADAAAVEKAQENALQLGKQALIILLVAALILVVVRRVLRMSRQDKS